MENKEYIDKYEDIEDCTEFDVPINQEFVANKQTVTVLLCGVGGQGTILAADLLARVAMAQGLDVKVSEIHGMSQRGGAVSTVVRFGENVKSMVTDPCSADFVVSFEKIEALRMANYVKSATGSQERGVLLVNDEIIKPQSVLTGAAKLPDNLDAQLADLKAVVVPAYNLAKKAGTARAANVVLLGALSKSLNFNTNTWKELIAKRVPEKYLEENLKAFDLGREFVA